MNVPKTHLSIILTTKETNRSFLIKRWQPVAYVYSLWLPRWRRSHGGPLGYGPQYNNICTFDYFGFLEHTDFLAPAIFNSSTVKCRPGDVVCDNGRCLAPARRCDLYIDCNDGTDEMFCGKSSENQKVLISDMLWLVLLTSTIIYNAVFSFIIRN